MSSGYTLKIFTACEIDIQKCPNHQVMRYAQILHFAGMFQLLSSAIACFFVAYCPY